MVEDFSVRTKKRIEFIDITAQVQRVVATSKIREGVCYIYIPHTTAAVTINENADPSVVKDINMQLSKMVPAGAGYAHLEGNADSHVKASLLGTSETVLVANGRLVLGTWQGIYFAEFDGPRSRQVLVNILETSPQ